MVIPLLLIIVGFVLLIKGADFLVNGASSLAKRYNVSDIAIGLTVVAMGTSAPELVVNIISGSTGHNDVVFGNIIGSNIFNMFLILGISSVIYPLTVQKNALWKEVPYSLVATIVFFILVNDQLIFGAEENSASILDGIILLLMFGAFLFYVFQNMQRTGDLGGDMDEIEMYGSLKTAMLIIFGIAGLGGGGKLIVDNAILIAESVGISEKVIGLTILAAGTSLPELATTAVAAFHKKSDLAVGNIVGSNIFNLLLVLGATAAFNGPLAFDIDLNTDLYIIMIGTFMLFLFMFTLQKYKLDRAEGALYLLGFAAYIVFLYFNRM
ncbi:calcium/sodium antiporter [Reichenbachiella ulvae]|uniref:Calcium/sodium antiporter n=1 Tax=Reichenbachiella ulvae TaxID=2980104 RepID=A0ABT3CRQ0_9BACT|nr:calcium/sodium antiporter [Reichenbachiella ulvae]MCV9386145.1 calcium/sodium antiporter [Reichenbachiella ulvae]